MLKKITIICIFAILMFISKAAYADAFMPTMVSANVLWLLALPLVVAVEGLIMAHWKWQMGKYRGVYPGRP